MWRPPVRDASAGNGREYAAFCLSLLSMLTVPFTAIGMGPLNLSDVFCLLSIGLLASSVRWTQLGLQRTRLVVIAGAMIVGGSVLGVAVSRQMNDIWTPFKYFVAGLAMFPVLCIVARTPKRWDPLCAAFVLGVSLNCIDAMLQVVDRSHFNAACITQGRGCGFTDHPNDLGYLIAVGVLFTVAGLSRNVSPWMKRFFQGALVIQLAGLAATGSIGSAIGMVGGLMVFGAGALWLRPQKSAPWAIFLVVAAIVLFPALGVVAGQTVVGKRIQALMSASSVADTTLGERFQGYEVAMIRIKNHPVLGVGTFHSTGNGTAPHNIFIGIWYEAGLIGLAGIILTLVAVVSRTVTATLATARMRGLGLAALACLGAVMAAIICSQVAPFFYRRAAWAPLWLAFAFAEAAMVSAAAYRQRK